MSRRGLRQHPPRPGGGERMLSILRRGGLTHESGVRATLPVTDERQKAWDDCCQKPPLFCTGILVRVPCPPPPWGAGPAPPLPTRARRSPVARRPPGVRGGGARTERGPTLEGPTSDALRAFRAALRLEGDAAEGRAQTELGRSEEAEHGARGRAPATVLVCWSRPWPPPPPCTPSVWSRRTVLVRVG